MDKKRGRCERGLGKLTGSEKRTPRRKSRWRARSAEAKSGQGTDGPTDLVGKTLSVALGSGRGRNEEEAGGEDGVLAGVAPGTRDLALKGREGWSERGGERGLRQRGLSTG